MIKIFTEPTWDLTRLGRAAAFGAAVLTAPLATAQQPPATSTAQAGAAGSPAEPSASEWTDIDEPCLIDAVHRHINETMPQEIRNREGPVSAVGRGFLISGFPSFGPNPRQSVGDAEADWHPRDVCDDRHFAPMPSAIRYFLTTAGTRSLNLNSTCPFPFSNARFGGDWLGGDGMACNVNGNRVAFTNVCTVSTGPFTFSMTSERDRLYFDAVRTHFIINDQIPEDCKISVRSDLQIILQTFLDRSTSRIEQLFREQRSSSQQGGSQ